MAYCFRKFRKKINEPDIKSIAYDFFDLKECIEVASDILETDENIDYINIYKLTTKGKEVFIRKIEK